MHSIQIFAIVAVLCGVGFLAASIFTGRRGNRYVPTAYQGKWLLLIRFMLFFLIGYLIFLLILVFHLSIPVEALTGSVFLAGAIFVFLVIDLSLRTIRQMRESENELSQVATQLSHKNLELEQEMETRKQAQEQAKSRLQHLVTLHAIDTIITSSLDLRVTLDVFLEEVAPRLEVDALVILLFNPYSQILEYGASGGFRTRGIEKTKERLGEGSAGTTARERRMTFIPDLAEEPGAFNRQTLIEGEGFVSYCAVPLVAKGQIKGVLEIFHRERLDPVPEWFEFLQSLAVQAAIAIDNATLFRDLQRSNADLILAYDTTIEGWSRALELRDKDTEGHTRRVTEMTVEMARRFGIGDDQLAHVRRGALLHDIGKMGVPDSILLKPEQLTPEEWKIMKRHPVYAFEMLSPIAYLRPALDIPYCHHEKWDGTGYPRGLKGEQIPLAARIFMVADMWDALCSERMYHEPWPRQKVCDHIQSLAGTHFDPEVVEKFLEMDWCREEEAFCNQQPSQGTEKSL
ncbi:MAG: HD domain-containing phosphohydrolase [Deltaproteobacteria bacterium]|jgi:HD-GYP domain-containing protein (c-di-GMP phosphodiesterase class II)